ncbi:hypothetical protein AB0C38_49310 [Amycolatopsis sp. NPDC048633]|uniref:hypothetical protein n=1 Tax=Amycolatopsis sp. NPDC048633 TaxID=3157095 RepID=UPI0033C8557A
MFTMTEAATEAINQLTSAQNVQAEGGLRVTLDGPPGDGAELTVEVAARPVAGDRVVAVASTQVFLARDTRVHLAPAGRRAVPPGVRVRSPPGCSRRSGSCWPRAWA